MNKFQPVKFRNIDELLDYLPEQEREIVVLLRQIILNSLPECKEKLAYNVPFYYKKSRICFIWPPSVPWGNVNIKGVQLGFCNGHLLKDEDGYLKKGLRKQVYWKEYYSTSQVEPDILREFLFEALTIDGRV